MASPAMASPAEVTALFQGMFAATPSRRGARLQYGDLVLNVFPQSMRRGVSQAAETQPPLPPQRGAAARPNAAARRAANRAAQRAGQPPPFPPAAPAAPERPQVQCAAPAPLALPQAAASPSTPAIASTLAHPSAAEDAAPAPFAAPAPAPPTSAAQQPARRPPASAPGARPSPDATMHPLSLTGAAAKQRTPPQSTTAPPPSTTAAPSLPPSRGDTRGGNAPKRVATQPAPSPSPSATHLAADDLRLRLHQLRMLGPQFNHLTNTELMAQFPQFPRPTPSLSGPPSRPSTHAQP